MLWIYAAIVLAGYVTILLFRDDASENVRKWIYPVLLILGIGGGWYFAVPHSDNSDCQSYGTRAGDC
jgi:hypothetical protein